VPLFLYPVSFDGLGLVLSGCHLRLVELVAGVQLLQIELEFVFVGDVDPIMFDTYLFVLETFSKGGEVHVATPFGPIFGHGELLGVLIERTPLCVQMLEDLDGLYMLVGGLKVF
jgi:hypothetical protein